MPTLTASTPPRTVSSSRSPCAQHTCPHTESSSSKLTQYSPEAIQMVRFLLAPTVRSSPSGHLMAMYFNRVSSSAMCTEKCLMAGRGRSLRPPTPCLAKTDLKNIARAADESARETLLSGSLPRPDHALQHELVPVASRESH